MRIVLDIETTLDHKHIHCAVTQDIDSGEVQVWDSPTPDMKRYIERSESIAGHNIVGFDAPVLRSIWGIGIPLRKVQDTLVLSRLANPERQGGHSLEDWGVRLGYPKGDFTDHDNRSPEAQVLRIEYCKRDVQLTAQVLETVQAELVDCPPQVIEDEYYVQWVISRQERHGFKLDVPYASSLMASLSDKAGVIEKALVDEFGCWYAPGKVFVPKMTRKEYTEGCPLTKIDLVTFNPGSRQHIAKKLKEKGWKPKKFTETGQPQVDESTLEGVDIPEAKKVLEYLLLEKRVSQIKSWLEAADDTGRVHGKVITIGAVTNRMAHYGPNLAQVPKSSSPYGVECRRCWTVDDGNVLVGFDASGLELRMLAHYMRDEVYVRELVSGDVHAANVRALGLTGPTARDDAKTFIYAFLYGAGPAKIGGIVGGGYKQGEALIKKFLTNIPSLSTLKAKVERLQEKGHLPGLDGRRVYVRSAHSALNTLLQSGGAILMKKALQLFDKEQRRRKYDVGYCVNVHDEIQVEVPEGIAEEVGKLGVWSIEEAGRILGCRCPMTGEYKIGKTWADTH